MSNQKAGTLEDRILTVIAEQLDKEVSSIKDNAKFIEDLGCDSLDLVELMMALEEEFKCEIPDDEAATILTIKDAKDYIKSKTSTEDDSDVSIDDDSEY